MYESITGQLFEIGRQLRQKGGYSFSPEMLQKHLQDAIEGRFVDFPTWKTIKLGTYGSTNAIRKALNHGFRVSNRADDILKKIEVSPVETEIELVVATTKQLTDKDRATTQEVFEGGKSRGWEPCPAEGGPQLRLQYRDQPKGDWLRIAMKPIAGSDGDLDVFLVEHDGVGLWLHALYGDPGGVWGGDGRWVFVRRK
ncbi:hypothetical protein ACFLZC_00340 [Patescibacteria group bacterium]